MPYIIKLNLHHSGNHDGLEKAQCELREPLRATLVYHSNMIFKQLFEPVSSTYTYILGCDQSGQAVLIDPVFETADRDLEALAALNLKLAYTLDTHIHADHLTAAQRLKSMAGSKIAAPKLDRLSCVDVGIEEGVDFRVGSIQLRPLHTPGHTDNHHVYVIEANGAIRLFCGDTLLIDGCGRTDFQNGDSTALFHSVRDKLFALPDETLVYPAHDYKGRCVSSIAQEKQRNERLKLDHSLETFIEIMANLKLPYPKRMECAVPANKLCGQCPPEVPESCKGACEAHDQG